ncbi:MAG: hypothetical protein R2865_04180 [Deinococcales bacterium]
MPTFKNVFNCFARRHGFFQDALQQQGQSSNDYHQVITNLFLLGIDLELVEKRREIKEGLEKAKSLKRVRRTAAPA